MEENIANDETKNNNVDGIKKISQADLEKSRKIVLDEIGESIKPVDNNKNQLQKGKMVDSLSSNSNETKSEVLKDKPLDKEKYLKKRGTLLQEIGKEPIKKKEAGRGSVNIDPFVKILPLAGKLLPAKDKTYAPDFKNIRPLVDELMEDKAKMINKTNEVKKKITEKTKSNNDYAEKLNDGIKPQLSKKLLKKVEYGQILKRIFGFSKNFRSNLIKTLDIIIISLLSFIIFYFCFIFIILKFNLDNSIFRKIDEYLPVPSLIFSDRIVDYYDYKDLKTALSYLSLDNSLAVNTKSIIIKNIILGDLKNKYRISDVDFENSDNFENKIAPLMTRDVVINQVAINRMNKLKNMIKNNDDFSHIAEKYGDEQGARAISANEMENLNYKKSIIDLSVGEVSSIIIQPDGYYLFQCYAQSNGVKNYNYIFIKAKSLDSYLSEEINKIKYISLVD